MHLLYLTFGQSLNNHIQAHFSISSFLAQKEEIDTINIITDYPVFYKNLEGFVNIIEVDNKTLELWKGEYNFFWRIKIKALEKLCQMYKNEPVLYLDSDTFLFSDIKLLKEAVIKGKALMHEDEGALSKEKSKTAKRMWKQVKNKSFSNISILPTHSMWNAGVVFTPNKKDNKECLLALEICDEMSRQGVTPRLIEQFALSVALQETYGLLSASNTIAHYWSNKESWNSAIEHFFISTYFKAYTIEQTVEEIRSFDFKKLPIKVKVRNTNARLKKAVEKVFPARDVLFVKD